MGTRLTVMEQVTRNATLKGCDLAVRVIDPTTGYIVKAARLFAAPPELRRLIPSANIEVRTPLGLLMDFSVVALAPAEIDAKAAEMDALFEIANPRQPKAIFPQTLAVEGQTYKRIMIGELTEIEAAQFLKPEEISGHNMRELEARLAIPSGRALVYTNEDDAKRYIQRANAQGKKYRFMTDAELEALPPEVRSQLKVGDNWFLVETPRGSGQLIWRAFHTTDRQSSNDPEFRNNYRAIFLVED